MPVVPKLEHAVISGAEVVVGQEEIDVRFSVSAAEERMDDRTGAVMACDDPALLEERWRCRPDPKADTSVGDKRHEIAPARTDQSSDVGPLPLIRS